MTRAEAYQHRGVVIVEHALPPDDLARMAGAFDAPRVCPDLWPWLEGHPVLTALAAELAGSPCVCGSIETRNLELSVPTWLEPWHRTSTSLPRPLVELVVHIDPVEDDAGPLEVLIGSHHEVCDTHHDDAGKMALCLCARGDILALHPDVFRRRQRPAKAAPARLLQMTFAGAAWDPRRARRSLVRERTS